MNTIMSIFCNPIFSIVCVCIIILLLAAIVIILLLCYKKNALITQQNIEIEILHKKFDGTEPIIKKILKAGDELYALSEEPDLDYLTRITKLNNILKEDFPWSVRLDQNIILRKIFSGINKEAINCGDAYKIRLLQQNIESFRTHLAVYTYPLSDIDAQKLRGKYLQLSMLALDVVDSLAERPYYYENQQGINVAILNNSETPHKPHEVTIIEDNQEKWALIMKGILDGIDIDEDRKLVFCGYKFK